LKKKSGVGTCVFCNYCSFLGDFTVVVVAKVELITDCGVAEAAGGGGGTVCRFKCGFGLLEIG
jgi:hypothetical protein